MTTYEEARERLAAFKADHPEKCEAMDEDTFEELNDILNELERLRPAEEDI